MNHSIKTLNNNAATVRAFTLLEVIIGIGLIGLVMTGIYSVAAASLKMSNDVTLRQQREMHLHSFVSVLRRNIEDIPGNAKISMESPAGAGGVLSSEIVLEDYPLAFSWARVAAGSKRVLIISDKDPRGGTQIRIRYLSAEEAESHEQQGAIAGDDGMGIVLISGLKSVRWRFFNPRTRTEDPEEAWEEDWVRPNERPSMVEMNVEFYDGSEPLRAVFWIPVVVNPETVVRGTQNGNRAGGAGGVQPPDAGGSDAGSSDAGGGTVRPPSTGGGTVRPPSTGGGTVRPPSTGGGKREYAPPRRSQGGSTGSPLPSLPGGSR